MTRNAAVIGAGVSGLTCGVLLAEAGFRSAIFADEIGQRTTSAAAAAVWYPYDAEPAAAVIAWSLTTFERLRSLAAAQGVVIPAGRWGKQKTLLTLLALGGILLARGLHGSTAFILGLSTGPAPQTFADYLLARHRTVCHLMGIDRVQPAQLTPAAKIDDGRITYPRDG